MGLIAIAALFAGFILSQRYFATVLIPASSAFLIIAVVWGVIHGSSLRRDVIWVVFILAVLDVGYIVGSAFWHGARGRSLQVADDRRPRKSRAHPSGAHGPL